MKRLAVSRWPSIKRLRVTRAGDVGLADLGHVEKLGIAQVLRANIARDRDRRGVDDAIDQTLHQQAHLVQLHDGHVRRRIEVPHFEHRPRQRVGCRTDTGNADAFSFQIRRRLDRWVDDEAVKRLVEDGAEKERIRAAQVSADAGVGDRLGDGDFAGEQGVKRGDAAGVNQLDLHPVLLEVAGVESDPRDRLIDGDGAVGDTQRSGFSGFRRAGETGCRTDH